VFALLLVGLGAASHPAFEERCYPAVPGIGWICPDPATASEAGLP
jgi:hypothetical protein